MAAPRSRGGAGPPGLGDQVLAVLPVRDIAELDQHRGDIGSFQDPETSGLQRTLMMGDGSFISPIRLRANRFEKALGFALARSIRMSATSVRLLGSGPLPPIASALFSASASRLGLVHRRRVSNSVWMVAPCASPSRRGPARRHALTAPRRQRATCWPLKRTGSQFRLTRSCPAKARQVPARRCTIPFREARCSLIGRLQELAEH